MSPVKTSYPVYAQEVLTKQGKSSRIQKFEQEFSFKEKRYQAIMILMWVNLNPKSEMVLKSLYYRTESSKLLKSSIGDEI